MVKYLVPKKISITDTEGGVSEFGPADIETTSSGKRLLVPGEKNSIINKDFEANKPNATIKKSHFKRNQTVNDAWTKNKNPPDDYPHENSTSQMMSSSPTIRNDSQVITSVRMPKKHNPEIVLNNLEQMIGDSNRLPTSGGKFEVEDSAWSSTHLERARMDSVCQSSHNMTPTGVEQSTNF